MPGAARHVCCDSAKLVSTMLATAPLIVFADDWGRHPSSAQHLVRQLLGDSAISWVNTIGTRAPKLTVSVLRRGIGKLLQWGAPHSSAAASGPAPQIHAPIMYPGFRTGWQRALNAHLLGRFLDKRFPNLADTVIVSTIPIVADLPERLVALRWIYYCVDDFSKWPGLDSEALLAMEQKFVRRADRIIVAGENLAAAMRSLGRESHLISHGIDLEHWRRERQPAALLNKFERPIALFWGLIDRRLDLAALRRLDQSMTAGTIVLVGPAQDPDPALARLARIRLTGPSSYENLPSLAAQADALIMPYADLAVTRAMQPLKLKEYLATGRPVVSTRLPALSGWEDCLDIADDPGQFAAAVLRVCGGPLPPDQSAARERLQHETWKIKARQFENIVFGV